MRVRAPCPGLGPRYRTLRRSTARTWAAAACRTVGRRAAGTSLGDGLRGMLGTLVDVDVDVAAAGSDHRPAVP